MSVVINGKIATLGNYLELSKNYSTDIQDEIRSAILDDTPISPYIHKCRDDSFKLNQIRLAIREYVPSRYISVKLSATNLQWIRKIHRRGYSMNVLDKYLTKRGILSISCDSLDVILSAYYDGVNVDSVDFNTVSDGLVGLICAGLSKQYPMWIITESSSNKSKEFIQLLMKGMNLNLDIHPFLEGDWDVDKVQPILSSACKMEYTVFMKHVNCRFSAEQIDIILGVATKYLDFLPLCLKDEEGYPVFNVHQMSVLADIIEYNYEAEKRGSVSFDIDEFLKPSMSDLDMYAMLDKKLSSVKDSERRVLSGSLPKKV